MSFHSRRQQLSAPNLYSSVPNVGLLAWNHNALSNADRVVVSGSSAAVVTGGGWKSVPVSVCGVPLPSAPNFNSCTQGGACPSNHSAPFKPVISRGLKPLHPPGL